MELNWSTFLLEIINFLVLVWILKRFLYKPVLDVIARRRAGIEQSLADANALHEDAENLKQQYEERLSHWERERQSAREALARELETERTTKLAELQTTLEQEREKTRVAEARHQADVQLKMEETALLQGARFAARLLEYGAGPETEGRLVELVIDELEQLPADRITTLRNGSGTTPAAITIVSAFPLPDEQRKRLMQALAMLAGPDIPQHFEQNRELLAGLHITIGAWILGMNIRDELSGFTALAHDE